MSTAFLLERFEARGDAVAVVAPSGRCTFAELLALHRRWDAELERRGVAPGAVVSLEGDFSPNTIALFVALVGRGAIVIPHRRGGARSERERRDGIAQAELRAAVDAQEDVAFESTGQTASHELYDELRRREHPGVVGFSSGSSGEPKAAVHDFDTWLDGFRPPRRSLATLTFLLFDHLGGVRTMLYALSNGATIVSTDDRSPDAVCALIEEHRVELLPATPTFFNLLLLSGAHRRHDLSSLEVISYGAEPMLQTTLDRLRAAFPGVKLQQTYGLIEVGPLRTKSRDDGSLWVKIGGEGVDTRVVDGVLQIRGEASVIGYLNAEMPITPDGWLVTGDLAVQDGEYLRILGRKSELINVGGEKVHPSEVENAIQAMDGVLDVTVRGEASPLIGQIVCAEVVPATAATDPGELAASVKRHCRERLERYKVPVKVRVVAELAPTDRFKKRRIPHPVP